MKISNEVAIVLDNSQIDGTKLYLPKGALDRKLYLAVNKVLEAVGGKWNRGEKAHMFEESPVDTLEEVLLTGEYTDSKKEYDFFETPETIALQLIQIAEIESGETVLEPSAGKGAVAKFLPGCDCIEFNVKHRELLQDSGFNVVGEDFLQFQEKYDVIIANPPFSKQQDIDHVTHMIALAQRRVVSVMSVGVMFRENKKTTTFRELVEGLGGEIIPLADKAFSSSGTNVRTCIVCVNT